MKWIQFVMNTSCDGIYILWWDIHLVMGYTSCDGIYILRGVDKICIGVHFFWVHIVLYIYYLWIHFVMKNITLDYILKWDTFVMGNIYTRIHGCAG